LMKLAKGWTPVEQEAVAAQDRQERYDAQSGVQMLRSKSIKEGSPQGGPIIIRFLEQGNEGPNAVNSYERHIFKKPDSRSKTGFFEQLETCLSEIHLACPACAAGIPTKRRGAYNLIQRQRPVYRKGADGKVVKDGNNNPITEGYQDTVVVFECSNTTANVLRRADHDFHGLMSRDLAIVYTGTNTNPYSVAPVDIDSGPQPMTAEDMALAAQKSDLDKVFAPPSAQEMSALVVKYGQNSGASPNILQQPVQQSGFALSNQPTANPYGLLDGSKIPAAPSAFGAAQPTPPPTPTPTTNQ
jgi:hypothetical protein